METTPTRKVARQPAPPISFCVTMVSVSRPHGSVMASLTVSTHQMKPTANRKYNENPDYERPEIQDL